MTKDIQLYDYQKDMVKRIEEAFESHQSVMVQMPTGTGKTHVLVEVVKNEEQRVKEPCVWIIAHRRELVSQIEDTVRTFGIEPYSEKHTDSKIRVRSIQWLTRHYNVMDEKPSLIVIDEAHHALAKTYAEVMNAFPEAKKLGVTATPCRLNKRGFTDLFDVLLCSHSIPTFIKDGYLSDFDYVSLSPSSEDQKKIDGLEKRATDGDYNVAEMQDVLDCKPSIERLFRTVMEFAPEKKGIVYAINIEHAEHVAEYYRENGIEAVAISSKTPIAERKMLIERFKEASMEGCDKPDCASLSLSEPLGANDGNKADTTLTQANNIQVLVNVDLFGEGFDCPDVEFVQLARPTLSLSKYLQMVGRGLRVAKNKECCIILDNVGLYRLFGLPTTEWDWETMFRGVQSGKGTVNAAIDLSLRAVSAGYSSTRKTNEPNAEMVVIARHDQPKIQFRLAEMQEAFRGTPQLERKRYGYMGGGKYIRIGDDMPGIYKTTHAVRLNWRLISKAENGVRKYYLLNESNERIVYVGRKCPWDEYADNVIERYYYTDYRNNLSSIKVEENEYITGEKRRPMHDSIRKNVWGEEHLVTYVYYGINKNKGKHFDSKDAYVCEHFMRNEYAISNNNNRIILEGLKSVKLSDDNIAEVVFEGEDKTTWVNLYTMQEFDERPSIERMGFVELLKVGFDYYFYKDRQMAGIPIRDWNCMVNERIFQFSDQYVILKEQPNKVYYVVGECQKNRQWYLKLNAIGSKNPKNCKEVPSAWLPRKY
jgi:superfamily II DNA or RNA helicase